MVIHKIGTLRTRVPKVSIFGQQLKNNYITNLREHITHELVYQNIRSLYSAHKKNYLQLKFR
jgi:hypothetical protein